MNIIARLHSIAFSLERDKNNRNLMAQEIKNNLVNHKSEFSLLPFLEEVIQSISQELQKIEHKPN
jgi:ribosomal 30S subunit maturation factor RimM